MHLSSVIVLRKEFYHTTFVASFQQFSWRHDSLGVMDVDIELQEVRERPPETLGLIGDADRHFHNEATW